MATAQKQLCGDNTSNANFWSWGKGISDFFAAQGWTKTDNNVTWNSTAAPGAGAYLYEIWQATDTPAGGGTFAYYLKIEYGTSASNSCPALRITVSTGATGSGGTLSGSQIGPFNVQIGNTTAETASATFECDFSGDAGGRMGFLMWRNATNANRPCFFSIERSQSSSGVYSGTYVTVCAAGYNSGVLTQQQTMNSSGAATTLISGTWATVGTNNAGNAFAGNVPLLPVFPLYGKVDSPLTAAATFKSSDGVEGATITATIYASHTFISSLRANFVNAGNGANNGIAMRYD